MIGRNTRFSFLLLCIALYLTVMETAVADEQDDWRIGRVFMSRAERLMLDNMRSSPQPTVAVQTSSNSSATVAEPPPRKAKPTGYILPSNGSPYRWENGHFQETSRDSIALGGSEDKIKISRHQRTAISTNQSESTNDESKPTESGESDRQPDDDSER